MLILWCLSKCVAFFMFRNMLFWWFRTVLVYKHNMLYVVIGFACDKTYVQILKFLEKQNFKSHLVN